MANYIFHDNNTFSYNPLPCGDYLLYQVGEMYCKNDAVITPHTQSCFEITFVVDGNGEISAQQEEDISQNDCFFSLIGEKHAINSEKENPLRFHFLGFKPLPSTLGEKYISIIKNHIEERPYRAINLPNIHSHIDNILSEIKETDFLSRESVSLSISKILIEIIRAYAPQRGRNISEEIDTESMLVYKIIDYLDANIYTIETLHELENEFNYSYNYLSSVFTKTTNFSISEYYLKLKMAKAMELLEEGNNVTKVSEKLNYSSIHNFSRAFKKYFGINPKEVEKKTK